MPPRLRTALVILGTVATATATAAQQRFSRDDAERCYTKLTRILQLGESPRARTSTAQTTLTETELNAYLRYHARSQVPPGIVDPVLSALGDGRVAGRAVVDLDAIRQQKARGWTDPVGYLSGKLPVSATGTLTTKDGVGRFQLESAEVAGVSVPKSVLQELLTYYSRTPEDPNGINMDEPFELPAGIREIHVRKGEATVVQ